jgi:hypothetical protein
MRAPIKRGVTDMAKKIDYNFTLVLQGINEQTEHLEDTLYESGCADALINFRDGTVYLDFDREAVTLEDAVISAISDVEGARLDIKVISVAPDPWVNEVDISRRINKTRQTVSNWIKGYRRPIPFPNPVMKLEDKSPLWRWYEVARWLFQQNQILDETIVENARFFEAINGALAERDKAHRSISHKLFKRLEGLA